MIRRGLLISILVIFYNYPNLIIGIMISILGIWISLIYYFTPHKSKKSNILTSLTDILIIFLLIVFIIINNKSNEIK